MPSVSDKQERTMRAAANNPQFAAKMKIPKKVAEEFVEADKKKKTVTKDMVKKRYGNN